MCRLATAFASILLPAAARAQPPPIAFLCDLPGGQCDAVADDLRDRLRPRQIAREGEGFPRARVTAVADGVRVEVEAPPRAPATSDVPAEAGVTEPWRIALTIEQLLDRVEAATPEGDGRAVVTPQPEARTLFFGLAGGSRGDVIDGALAPALQGGLVAGWHPGPTFVARFRAYGELLFADPWATEAFGVGGGPGLLLVDRPSLRVDVVLEVSARIMRARYRSNDPGCRGEDTGNGLEAGGGLWADLIALQWMIRPFLTAGVEAFARRNPDVACDSLDPPLVAPAILVGVVYDPG